MGDEYDKVLLARLNNLKQSNISLKHSHIAVDPVSAGQDDTPEDLLARFQQLHRKRSFADGDPSLTKASIDEGGDEQPSPTVEELLADLSTEKQYKVGSEDLKEANKLLVEAKRALPDVETQAHFPDIKSSAAPTSEEPGQGADPARQDEYNEEAEAAESLQHILDEIAFEKDQESSPVQESPRLSTARTAGPDSFASLVFPSIPEGLKPPPSHLSLPSAPKDTPSTQGIKGKARDSGYTDEQIDSWCVICCANAAVKCFGCDGDLYCWGCWREGHVGEDVGLEEKNHVWERLARNTKRV
ncbi:hypothetical protein P7C71_g5892, partial [Lecanoromycetidae sp. Uapishka_2]